MMKNKKSMGKKPYFAIWSAVFALLIGIVIAINSICLINDKVMTIFLSTVGGGISGQAPDDLDTQYFKSDYASLEALREKQTEFVEAAAGEGAVLLKNANTALPLQKNAQISLFGIASVTGAVSGTGSGDVKLEDQGTLSGALSSEGFGINKTLFDFYAKTDHKHGPGVAAGNGAIKGDWKIDEAPWSEVTASSDVTGSFASYKDAAVIVITRKGGEGGDLPLEMSRHGGDADKHILELTEEEKGLLAGVKAQNFGKIILLLNSANPMELGFLGDPSYGVDACLWYAGTGYRGINAIGKIMSGKINPSGRLVDTYAYDDFSSPAMQNFGDFRYVDADGKLTGYCYVNYVEGIYVGYKYYETRYEDVVTERLNAGDFDYASTVQFPFGYGLSYSDFKWSEFDVKEADGKYTVSLTVTNESGPKGKDVVEIYAQMPYISQGIEKAAVNLVGYAKTDELEQGASQKIEVTVDLADLASYDEYTEEGYVLDIGEYFLTAAKDAHAAANNFLAKKGYTTGIAGEPGDPDMVYSFELTEKIVNKQAVTKNEISNKFDDAKADNTTFLSRGNWKMMDNDGLKYATSTKTGESEVTDALGTVNTIVASTALTNNLKAVGREASGAPSKSYPAESSYKYGEKNGLEIIDLYGKPYDDPQWETLLDQMKLSEMHSLYKKSGYGTDAIESINKPKTSEYDGPAGLSNYITGVGTFSYPAAIMMAATWNVEIQERMGVFVGEDGIATKTSGWYAPATNIHRTPFAGRNYEYYSEDALLSGRTSTAIIKGAQSKGIYVYLKHFALNDQETNRSAHNAIATWSNEQAIREIYLKPFQIAVEEGNARGMMSSVNRIGYRYTAGHYNLMTGVARNEWGFNGVLLTDYNSTYRGARADQFLAAGGDLILATAAQDLTDAKQDWARAELRRATKNVLYNQANSLAMNGFFHGANYDQGFPVYKILLILLDILAGAGIVVVAFFVFRKVKMTDEEFAERKRWSAKTKIIVFSSLGAVLVALIIVFFTVLFPMISSALLM